MWTRGSSNSQAVWYPVFFLKTVCFSLRFFQRNSSGNPSATTRGTEKSTVRRTLQISQPEFVFEILCGYFVDFLSLFDIYIENSEVEVGKISSKISQKKHPKSDSRGRSLPFLYIFF